MKYAIGEVYEGNWVKGKLQIYKWLNDVTQNQPNDKKDVFRIDYGAYDLIFMSVRRSYMGA